MLKAVPGKSLPWRVFYTALQPEFPDVLAERQLNIAIDWGRYAELIDYDDSSEVLSLDVSGGRVMVEAVTSSPG